MRQHVRIDDGTYGPCDAPEVLECSLGATVLHGTDEEEAKRLSELVLTAPEPSRAGASGSILPSFYGRIPVRSEAVLPYLLKLREALPEETFLRAREFKRERDRGDEFHLTVITARETRALRKRGIRFDTKRRFSYELIGVGSAVSPEGDRTWFVVVSSPELSAYRESLGLERLDFHVTLGFIEKDVHGVPKDASTLLAP